MAEPTCPNCGASGVEHMVSKQSVERSKSGQPWFVVIYCEHCGHVYDVIAKHVFAQAAQARLVLPDP